jgi:hypothetical protein
VAAHNLNRSREALEATGATCAYTFGIAPADSHLFGILQEKLESVTVTDRDSLISTNTEIFSDTPQNELIAVHKNWMKQLRSVIKKGGQHHKN